MSYKQQFKVTETLLAHHITVKFYMDFLNIEQSMKKQKIMWCS